MVDIRISGCSLTTLVSAPAVPRSPFFRGLEHLEDLTRGGPEQAHPLNPPAPGMFQPLAVSVTPSREKVTLRVGTRGAGCLSDVASSWFSSLLALMLRSRAEVGTKI